jgi:hypothetical protein
MTCGYRKFWTVLLIVAFATMGVSPACNFISGDEGYIEICNADNEIRRITLAEAGIKPATPVNTPHKSERVDCMFCVAGAAGKLAAAQSVLIETPGGDYLSNRRGSFYPKAFKGAYFDARGPPSSVV